MLVAAVDTATLTLSCALVDLSPGAPPRVRCERTDRVLASKERLRAQGQKVRAQGQADEPAPERAGGSGGREGVARVSPRQDRREVHRAAGSGGPSVPPSHSAALPRALVDLLTAEGLTIPDVEGYAIGLGPGSFTGLRIGLATWKGLAYANKRPIAGASSLAAMALAAAPAADEGAILVPLLDAKKGEVYAGFYRVTGGGVAQAADDAALPPEALAARVAALARDGARPVAFGEGYDAYAGVLSAVPRLRTDVATPPGRAVAALAAERLVSATYDREALFALEPRYVRPSEAELKFPAGLVPGVR